MKLDIFLGDKKKKNVLFLGIGIVVLFLAAVLIYRTYSIYQEKQEYNLIQGSVPNQDYDLKFAFVLEDGNGNKTVIQNVPEGRNYNVVMSCNNGAIGVWDYERWGPVVDNLIETRTKCTITFQRRYVDSVLNGTDPVLKEGLIPVTIDNDGVVRKANLDSEWYKYSDKKWANAVILEDESIQYQNEEEIPESNIESYFVWIPRYKYKIFNEGNYEDLTSTENRVKTIEVEFESKEKETSNGSKVDEWLTHPAFTSFDVNGIWVGKFETGYKGATDRTEALQNIVDTEKVEVKPNVYSWRSIQVSNAHLNSYNYKREYDSHMMKNTEWGAVAYLSHSKYGSQTSVRINNNSAYITGYAAVNEPTCGYAETADNCKVSELTTIGVDGTNTYNYNNPLSVVASTTGNYSGIYDMSGGLWEYVMGVMVDKNDNPASGRNDTDNSNFIGTLTNPSDGSNQTKTSWIASDGGISFPESKYYDQYAYGEDDEHYNRRILGDATGEMGPFTEIQRRPFGSWYANESWFISSSYPWFTRGGPHNLGTGSGVFTFGLEHGGAASWVGFRLVLAF